MATRFEMRGSRAKATKRGAVHYQLGMKTTNGAVIVKIRDHHCPDSHGCKGNAVGGKGET